MKNIVRSTEGELKELVKEQVRMSLNETSLNRVIGYISGYGENSEPKDIAMLTAYRGMYANPTQNTFEGMPQCPKELRKSEGDYYTRTENRQRNRELKAVLIELGYGVTKVNGNYIENYKSEGEMERGEETFFVVNLNNKPNFFEDIRKLSEYYNQDSFLYKGKDNEDAILFGTNNSSFPGYCKTFNTGKLHIGVENEFDTRVGNSKIVFTDNPSPDRDAKTYTHSSRGLDRKVERERMKNDGSEEYEKKRREVATRNKWLSDNRGKIQDINKGISNRRATYKQDMEDIVDKLFEKDSLFESRNAKWARSLCAKEVMKNLMLK